MVRLRTTTWAVLAFVLLAGAGGSSASNLNEVGSLLVFPAITTFPAAAPQGLTETFITITNTGMNGMTAHASYVNGDEADPLYCYECNFSFPLTGYDTETLVVTSDPFGIAIESEDGTVSRSCPYEIGMLVIALEDGDGNTVTDNLLFGEQVVVNYDSGYAFSIPAIPFQGGVGDGDRNYEFDNLEYTGFPRRVAADFLAPNSPSLGQDFFAQLVLFTLNFDTQYPPVTDCDINGFDAHETNFSSAISFGCWTSRDICDMDPELCYPNLGNPGSDTHGWLALDCHAGGADGGVHGAIVQMASPVTKIRRNDPAAPTVNGWAAWGRLLYQSATAGDSITMRVNPAPPGPGGF